jgi:hypothetical protein
MFVRAREAVRHLTTVNVMKVGMVRNATRLYVLGSQTVRVHAMAGETAINQNFVIATLGTPGTIVSMRPVSDATTMEDALGGTSVSVVEDSKDMTAQV